MLLFGFCGTIREVIGKKKATFCLTGLLVCFVATLCSRIGHGYDYSDITHYVDYFMSDNDAYFEPGYVFFTNSIKTLFGYKPTMYIAFVGFWILLFVLLSNRICFSYYNKTSKDVTTSTNRFILPYSCSFFFLFSIYWGCSFGCEVIRLGMAVSVLFCSLAFALNGKYLLSLLFVILAVPFQYTSVAFLGAILFISVFKSLHINIYIYWLVLMLICDILFASGLLKSFGGASVLGYVLNFSDTFSHYDAYDDFFAGDNGWISLQYFAYYIFGIYMLSGNLNDERYNKTVMIYYLGLTVGVLLRGTSYGLRMQWIFFPAIVFAFYYYIKDKGKGAKKKMYVISLYAIIQAVMAMRYLGALHL